MSGSNGESGVASKYVSDRELLEALIEGVTQLGEQLEEQSVIIAELIEKIDNISTPGVDYGFDE